MTPPATPIFLFYKLVAVAVIFPINWFNPVGEFIVGYDVDYGREIARAMFGDPARVQFRAVNSADRIEVLNSGQVDLIADSMTINCERQRKVLFSTDYFDSGQKVLVRFDAPYATIDDLGGRKVCAPQSTTSIRTIADVAAHHRVPVSR